MNQDVDVAIRRIAELNEFFYPRSHWTNRPYFASKTRQIFLQFLYLMERAGKMRIRRELLLEVQFDRWQVPRDPTELEQWQLAVWRRGHSDLKMQTWSAFRHLKKQFPRASIECQRFAPYCYILRHEGIVVTAGNVEPEDALRLILSFKATRFGIAGWSPKGDNEFAYEELCMGWLEIDPDAFERLAMVIARHDAEEARRIAPLIEAVEARMRDGSLFS